MKFNLVVEIDDACIDEYIRETNMPEKAVIGLLGNSCYLGLDCIQAIILRQFDIDGVHTYVEKSE
jgi:hypothetical protein